MLPADNLNEIDLMKVKLIRHSKKNTKEKQRAIRPGEIVVKLALVN